jgi:hypothetical protein
MQNKIFEVLNEFKFQDNDEETRDKVVDALYEALNGNIQVKEFAVRCNEHNNTPERIAAGELWVDVRIRETGAEEFNNYEITLKPEPIGELSDQSNPD